MLDMKPSHPCVGGISEFSHRLGSGGFGLPRAILVDERRPSRYREVVLTHDTQIREWPLPLGIYQPHSAR